MSGAVALPECEVQDGLTSRGLLEKNKPSPLVAVGAHKNSRIDLYRLSFGGTPQVSVFVYPSWYDLRSGGELVYSIDSRFSDISPRITTRTFRNVSVEDLDQAFVSCARKAGLISLMDHEYSLHRPPIYEHSFVNEACVFLEDVIKEMRMN